MDAKEMHVCRLCSLKDPHKLLSGAKGFQQLYRLVLIYKYRKAETGKINGTFEISRMKQAIVYQWHNSTHHILLGISELPTAHSQLPQIKK